MAVQEQTPYIEHIANGVTTSFALEFECKDKEHLIVLVDNVEPNVGTWSLVNGSVVFGTAPVNGKIISIQRNTPFRRDTNFQSYDNSLRPATINKDFDWIWYKLQELGVADWILGNRIDALKNYVDDRDDELRAYLMEEIRKQGVALDQLDEYYNYLMQQLAQIAVSRGWDASFITDAGGSTQQDINDFGGAKWRNKAGGYALGATVKLDNGDIVKNTTPNNTVNPNVDMTGWVNTKYEVSFFVDARKFGLVSNETIDQADRIVAINNYVNSIPINNGIPVIIRTPAGYFKSSQGFEFDRPAILKANQDSMFDYIGTGTAIRLGKSNIPSIANTEFSYGVDGVLLTGATNSKYGIYISQYIVEPTLRNMRFVDFGNPNDVESWAVFCQADNWDIYIKDCKAFWLAKNNVNFLKVNGTRLDGSSDFGNSRLNVVDTLVQNMYTRSGGIAFFVNAFKTRFEGVVFQGAKTCVQLGEYAQVVEFSGGYCEAIYDNCENFIKVGEDGYLSVKEISNLSITGVYVNLHNTNNPYGNTDTKFLVAAENVKLLNLNLSNIRTINSIKYPLLNLNNISGQTHYLSEVQHDNPLLHNINDDNIQCLSFSKNLLRNGDLSIWQRGSEFNHTGGSTTKLADGYALLSDSTTAINIYKNPINGANNFPKLSNSLLNVVSIGSSGTYRTLRIKLGALKNFSNKTLSLSFYLMTDVAFMANVVYVQKKGGVYTYKSMGEVDLKVGTYGKKYAVAGVSLDAGYDVVNTDTAYIDISLPLTVFNISFSAFYLQNSLLNYGFEFGCFIDNLNFYRSLYQASDFNYFGSGIKNYQIELRPIMLKTPEVIAKVVYADAVVNYNAAIPASSNSKFVFSLNNQANDVALNWTADCDEY